MKNKFLKSLLIAIGLLVTSLTNHVWAWSFNGTNYFYLVNKSGMTHNGSSTYIQMVIGKGTSSGYTSCYNTPTVVANTQLVYKSVTVNGWSDATYMGFMQNGSNWGEGSWGKNNITSNATKYALYTSGVDASNNQIYVLTPSSNAAKTESVSLSYMGNSGYSCMNKTITIKAKVSEDGGSNYSESSAHGKLTGSSKAFSSYTTCNTDKSATLNDGTSSTTMSCGYTAQTILKAADKTGYVFKGWYDASGNQIESAKNCTIYVTEATTYYAYYMKVYSIAASSTVVWDVAGNDKSWDAVYLYKYIEGTGESNDAFTQCGSTTQYAKTYASVVNNMKVFLFRAQNGSTWTNYKQTTDIYQDVSGIALYTYDNTKTGTKLNWHLTSPGYVASNGQTVYFDNTATQWTQPKFKYGTQWFNRYVDMTQVPGTANLWQYTMPHDIYYGKYKVADEFGWTDYNDIDDDHCAHYTQSQAASITSAKTVIPSTNGAPCTTSILDGYTRSVTISAPSNGTITVTYTDVDNSSKEKTSGSFSVAQTCIITVSASPSSGYVLSSLTVGGNAFTSGNTYTVRANTTISATFTAETTHDVDVSYICTDTDADVKSGTTTAVGETTASTFEAGTPNGFSFTRWVVGSGLTITEGSTSTNTIKVKSLGSGTYTLRAEYTEVLTTSWYISGATGSGSPFAGTGTSGTRMSKKSGHSAEEIYYCTISVGTTATGNGFSFNPYNSAESKNYGNASADITKANNSADVYGDNSTALHFKPYVTGNYEFKLDNTGAHPVLTVTWPVYNQLRVSAASPTDATNTGNFDLADKGSNNWSVKRTLNAKTTYTFKMMYDSEWFGNSGNFTRASNSANNIGNTGNMTVYADVTGEYTFTFNSSNHNFSITYPDAFTVQFGSDGHGTVTATATSTGGAFNSGAYVASGDVVTFSESNNTGYRLKGWYTTAGGSTSAGLNGDNELTINGNKTVYAQYYENLSTITVSAGTGGTVTTGSGTHSLGVTTTQAINASASNGYSWSTWTISGNAALGTTATTANNTAKGDGTNGGTGTIQATFTPKQYDVVLDVNGGSGANQTVRATFAADMPSTLKGGGAIAVRTKTGYNFDGYTKNNDGTGTKYYTSTLTSNNVWDLYTNSTETLYAKWNAKQSAITFDYQTGVTGYSSSGNITNASGLKGTYDADMTALTGTMPSAINGYAFMGFYDAVSGGGTKYYNADGTSAHAWDKDTESGTTLYAHWKKAQITALTLAESSVGTAITDSISVTPTIEPTPEGIVVVCYEVQYSDGTPLPTQPAGRSVDGNTYRFKAPSASATYKIEAKLHLNTCSGTVLDTRTTTFEVAGEHIVTIQYQDGDGRTLKASTTMTGRPLVWSSEFSAPDDIVGYTFDHWTAGEGVTITDDDGATTVTTTTESDIKMKATYEGNLTAVYTKKDMIYFYNNLGWEHVYVYFYSSDKYWNNSKGTGAKWDQWFENEYTKPHYRHFWGEMTAIGDGNIYYFDYQEAAKTINPTYWNEINGYTNVAFTKDPQGYGNGDEGKGYQYFYQTEAVRRGDFNHSLSMFVPLADQTPSTLNNTKYYNDGYWMNYPESTGYTLKIYNSWNADKTTGAAREYPFPFSVDKKMPLKLDVEFNDGAHAWFMVYRNDGSYFGKHYTITQDYNDEQALTSNNDKMELTPSAPGIYTITLTYHDDGAGHNNYYLDVDYPVAVNDYRIVYHDEGTWSNGKHSASWYHPSDIITKIGGAATEKKTDIVSFYIGKDSVPTMKFQYVSAINASTGAVTWTDVTGGGINLGSYSSDITKAGVYNVYVSQPVGGASIQVDSIKPYTGNFYIRTDCAGSTKWDSYTTLDHHMTYSEYAETVSGYSHYYCHWVTAGTNVKFCIANDYSVCISDTLEGDTYTGQSLAANANIRFMYNDSTNKISRAYIAGSGTITDRFLVLEGDSKMYNEDGNALTGVNQDHDKYGNYLGTDNQVIMQDDENFVYERTIKVNATARAKLTAKYNGKVQYFKGEEGDFAEGTTVQLLGGTYNVEKKYKMRIVYDFKTNRLVTAYEPEGTVDEPLAIQADLMLIRTHQEAGEQLTFSGSGELSEVHTVYGVMRFNRWTLNNKSTSDGHALLPTGEQKSTYERGLYWISFPFNVNLSDVFGFGTYGVDWIIEYYDGASRASKGFWKDSPGFWEYVMPSQRSTYVLQAGKGYVLALDLDRMKDNNTTFWSNNIEQVELFFPSTSYVNKVKETNVTTTVDSHECTIDRTNPKGGTDINKNRTKADSHWNMIGVPSYANYNKTLSDGSSPIDWNTSWYENPIVYNLPYLYEYNLVDNSYTVQSGTTYLFKVMHAYMVQYHGELHWSLASATPQSIVSRRRFEDKPQSIEFRLELQQNDKMADQTFVRLSNDEEVSTNFVFDEDLCKEFNKRRPNIYSIVENYIPTAGNILPMSNQTTVVPVGVQILENGDYTFAIPEGTSGVGVTLIDNETGIRTTLSALNYIVTLEAGTYDNRFVLEISPIMETPTDMEGANSLNDDIRKVMIDGILYIVKDGVMFDARGARVQ